MINKFNDIFGKTLIVKLEDSNLFEVKTNDNNGNLLTVVEKLEIKEIVNRYDI